MERGPRSRRPPRACLRMGGSGSARRRWPTRCSRRVGGLRPLPDPLPPVGVGLSGFEAAAEEDLRAGGASCCARSLPVERLAIASDGLTSLLGALGERDGAVVAAGTGTVVRGAGAASAWSKVDGWGSLLGDAGSGFAIGRPASTPRCATPTAAVAPRRCCGRPSAATGRCRDLPERIYRRRRARPGRSRPSPPTWRTRPRAAESRAPCAILADAGARARAHGMRRARPAVRAGRARRRCRTPATCSGPGAPLLEPFTARGGERGGRRTEVVPPAGDSLAGAALLAGRATA